MHVCSGSLCDLCRARVLGLILGNGEKSTPPKATEKVNLRQGPTGGHNKQRVRSTGPDSGAVIDTEDTLNLLKVLAENTTSRSVKEQLHSRLLSISHSGAESIKNSIQGIRLLQSKQSAKQEPRSHFSDSSDDEMTEGSQELTKDVSQATSRGHGRPNRAYRSTDDAKSYQLCVCKRDDQEVFDLEI